MGDSVAAGLDWDQTANCLCTTGPNECDTCGTDGTEEVNFVSFKWADDAAKNYEVCIPIPTAGDNEARQKAADDYCTRFSGEVTSGTTTAANSIVTFWADALPA